MTDRALLMTPSRGLGGGIERYVETLEAAFTLQGVDYGRVDQQGLGWIAQRNVIRAATAKVGTGDRRTRLVVAHRKLLPAAMMVARQADVDGISVLCYGADIWASRIHVRSQFEKALIRRTGIRAVSISSFTAGVLFRDAPSVILPPGLSQQWFDTLVGASGSPEPEKRGVELVTVFRLASWRDKGLPEILEAVKGLHRKDVHLTVIGVGPVPPELAQLASKYERCTLHPDITDGELARRLAGADLLILASRTRAGQKASGEGFGLVLLEAQLAGTPVVAPAYGGSHDAFIDQVTGMAPADESAVALTQVLTAMLDDPVRLAQMGKRASEWAREAFAPDRYASLAVARLL